MNTFFKNLANEPAVLRVDVDTVEELPLTVLGLKKSPMRRMGFTLVEILVVMGIIATLLGLGVGAIKSMASSKGVSTAVPLAESVFKHAREIAKSTGEETKVVIYGDNGASSQDVRERYLRMIGIAKDYNGTLKLIARPITLPSNTYFNPNLSSKQLDADTVKFPGDDTARACYAYAFNSEGCNPNNLSGHRKFVVQAGKLRPGGTPDVDINNSSDVGGFKIWSSGKTAMYRKAKQIEVDSGDLEFE